MSDPTKTYRLYSFDSEFNILTVELIEAARDEDAIAHAEAVGRRDKCEIWDGGRLVAHIDGERRQA